MIPNSPFVPTGTSVVVAGWSPRADDLHDSSASEIESEDESNSDYEEDPGPLQPPERLQQYTNYDRRPEEWHGTRNRAVHRMGSAHNLVKIEGMLRQRYRQYDPVLALSLPRRPLNGEMEEID